MRNKLAELENEKSKLEIKFIVWVLGYGSLFLILLLAVGNGVVLIPMVGGAVAITVNRSRLAEVEAAIKHSHTRRSCVTHVRATR